MVEVVLVSEVRHVECETCQVSWAVTWGEMLEGSMMFPSGKVGWSLRGARHGVSNGGVLYCMFLFPYNSTMRASIHFI